MIESATEPDYIPWVSYAQDGDSLLPAQQDQLRFVRPADGTITESKTGYTRGVSGIVFFPDGRTLASTRGAGQLTLLLWDVSLETPIYRLQDTANVSDWNFLPIDYNPDGKTALRLTHAPTT